MTATPGKNPFRPGVGTRPLHLAGRDAPMRRFRAMIRAAPELPANMRLTGLRGVGKTVLLGEFDRLARIDGWMAAGLEFQPGHNVEESLVQSVIAVCRRAKAELSRIERLKAAVGDVVRNVGALGLTWNEFTLSYTPGADEGDENMVREVFETVEMTIEKGRLGLVLLFDESQVVRDERDRHGEHPLSLLISSIVALQRKEIPVGLVLCGLPTLSGNLLRARSYTERMFRGEEIGSLDPADARAAFTQPLAEDGGLITAEGDLVRDVVEEVEGYPYFIQLWGAEVWDAAGIAGVDTLTTGLLNAVRRDIYRRLDTDFYEPRVSTLTPAEQDVLLASAVCPYPPLVVSDLNESIAKSPANINVLLGRLVENGVLYRIRKGQYEYTAPKFRDYLVRRTASPSSDAPTLW